MVKTMRLFLLGATGHTGTHILDLALSRGHEVTVFARTPAKVTRQAPDLRVVQGDALEVNSLAAVMPGHDAVLSALGPSFREAFRPSTLLAECAAATVAAMQMAGLSRLAIVSAAVLFPEKGLRFAFFRWFLRHHARDLVSMESVVRATPFDWTIARPPRLVEDDDDRYRSANGALPVDGFTMSFRAVAAFLLDSVEQRSHAREIVGLAAPRGAS